MFKRPPRKELTVEKVKQLLDYNPETGKFTWKFCPAKSPGWNTRFAGNEAGTINSAGYRAICIDYYSYGAHVLAWFITHSYWPTEDIDHEDRIRTNNRLSNLREATRTQNLQNTKLFCTNSSGIRGVSWDAQRRRWAVYISIENKTVNMGRYLSKDMAIIAYNNAVKKYYSKFADSAQKET